MLEKQDSQENQPPIHVENDISTFENANPLPEYVKTETEKDIPPIEYANPLPEYVKTETEKDNPPIEYAKPKIEYAKPKIEKVRKPKKVTVIQIEKQSPKIEKVKTPKKDVDILPENVAAWKNRFSVTINFTSERGRIIKEIIEKGIQQNYWRTQQEFFNKLVDFGVNSQLANIAANLKEGFVFGVPDDAETMLFVEGYYFKFLQSLKTCK